MERAVRTWFSAITSSIDPRTSRAITGEHARRVRWMRLGSAHDRVFHVRMTDDAAFNPVAATIEAV